MRRKLDCELWLCKMQLLLVFTVFKDFNLLTNIRIPRSHRDIIQDNLVVYDSLFCQLYAQILCFNTFVTFLYMFRALICSSSGGQILLLQHLVSSLSSGDCSVHRLREDPRPLVMNSHQKSVTIPDAALIQFVLLKMSIIVLETCRGM